MIRPLCALLFLVFVALASGSAVINDPVPKLVDYLMKGPGKQRLVYGLTQMRHVTIQRVREYAKYYALDENPLMAHLCETWWGDRWWGDNNWYKLFLTIDDYNDQGIGITSLMRLQDPDTILPHVQKLADGTASNAVWGLPSPVGIHFIRNALNAWEKSKQPQEWWSALYGVKDMTEAERYFPAETLVFLDQREDVKKWASLLSQYAGYVGLQDFGEGADAVDTMRGNRITETGYARLKKKAHFSKNLKNDMDWSEDELRTLAKMMSVQTVQSAAQLYLAQNNRMRYLSDLWCMYAFFRRTSKLGIRFATTVLNGIAFNEAGAVLRQAHQSFVNIDVFRESRPKGIKEALDLVDQSSNKFITLSEWKLAKEEYKKRCGDKCIVFYSEGHDVKRHKNLKAAAAYYNQPQILDASSGKLKKKVLISTGGLQGLGLDDDGVEKAKSLLERLFGFSNDKGLDKKKGKSKNQQQNLPPLPRVVLAKEKDMRKDKV